MNAFNDGPLRYEYDWLRRNDKDMATLAWELDAARRAKGFGGLRAVHQLGHSSSSKFRKVIMRRGIVKIMITFFWRRVVVVAEAGVEEVRRKIRPPGIKPAFCVVSVPT